MSCRAFSQSLAVRKQSVENDSGPWTQEKQLNSALTALASAAAGAARDADGVGPFAREVEEPEVGCDWHEQTPTATSSPCKGRLTA